MQSRPKEIKDGKYQGLLSPARVSHSRESWGIYFSHDMGLLGISTNSLTSSQNTSVQEKENHGRLMAAHNVFSPRTRVSYTTRAGYIAYGILQRIRTIKGTGKLSVKAMEGAGIGEMRGDIRLVIYEPLFCFYGSPFPPSRVCDRRIRSTNAVFTLPGVPLDDVSHTHSFLSTEQRNYSEKRLLDV